MLKTGERSSPLRNHRKIAAPSLPPSDEGGVTAGDGGRENSARVVEDADPYKLTAKSAQNPCLPREGGVGVADGGSVKGQTLPVSHPLDSPLSEEAKKDCAYAPQNLHQPYGNP